MRYLTAHLNSDDYSDRYTQHDMPLINPILRVVQVGAIALVGGCFGPLAMGASATVSFDGTILSSLAASQMSSRLLPTSGFMDVPIAAPVVSDDGYILGAGDRLKLDFFSLPEFSGDYAILPNGAVNLPQVGMVSLQGYTVQQASQILQTRYSPILTRPVININVVATRPVMIAIAGEIERPGAYSLTSSTGDRKSVV